MTQQVDLSVIVPVCDLYDQSGLLARAYLEELGDIGKSFELVYVLDAEHVDLLNQLKILASEDPRLRIVLLAKNFGESAALTAGFAYTTGEIILTLPAYSQIEKSEIHNVLDDLNQHDISVAVRTTNEANRSIFKSTRRKFFHWLVFVATGQSFADMGCGVRALKRSVADELPLYGDQFRFFPLLAARRGFRVSQVKVSEIKANVTNVGHGPRAYFARLLDLFAIVFLTRFTKKPLRFFGTIGSIIFAFGAIFLVYIIVQRLFYGVALADRPALLLTSLMVVLGVQIFALGLLGELIIFTHAKDMKEYTIAEIIN